MRDAYINLPINRKRMLFIISFFSVFSFWVNVIASIVMDTGLVQLDSLMHSDYVYAATMRTPAAQDSYYEFDAGICFAISPNAETSLNANILMQAAEAEYTDLVYWNADKLDTCHIAVSRSIARENGLDIGDMLYSKHIVDGTVYEYSIEQILPEAASAEGSAGKNYQNGIIIMGYDRRYSDNITFRSIVFAKKPIEELAVQYSDVPENIVYRDDEIMTVFKKLLPYLLVYVLLSALNVVGAVCFLARSVAPNFRRLAALGFGRKALDSAYRKAVTGVVFWAVFAALFISAVIFDIAGDYQIKIIFLSLVVFIELATLLRAAAIWNRRMWRR